MQVKELIRQKREGHENDPAQLEKFIGDYVRGEVKDYQVAAWLMAVFFRGLSLNELSALTRAMLKSGKTFNRPNPRKDVWVDKHSTGGVGDKTSLILVPLVTAVSERLFGKGAVGLPMVSGRGLGHSGGTLDKLEAVKGFSPQLPIERALELMKENGFFMMGQTADLAPADRLMYALRDVTATVESIPLIVSSIMSKKLAENLDALVLDVKTGSGAFMETENRARALARALIDVAKSAGVETIAVLSRMDEPLGFTAGNFIELEECADFLSGRPRERGLEEVTLTLAAWMVHLGGRRQISLADAEAECRKELSSPTALALYKKMFEVQGGDWKAFEEDRKRLPKVMRAYQYRAPRAGYLHGAEAKALGVMLSRLGGGRNAKEDQIDPFVGLAFAKKIGDPVAPGETILTVYYRNEGQESLIENTLKEVITVGPDAVAPKSWVVGVLQ